MSVDIAVVIGVFAPNPEDMDWWVKLATERAVPSIDRQTVKARGSVISCAPTLHEARNYGAQGVKADWIVFLDADDELDPHYIEAMTEAIEEHGTGHLYGPATLGIRPDGVEDAEAILIPERPLTTGNYLVIGTAVERSLFLEVGGFYDWPAWEDWCLWLRCWGAGAGVVRVPDAIYRVHVNPNSRNESAANNRRLFKDILGSYQHWKSHR